MKEWTEVQSLIRSGKEFHIKLPRKIKLDVPKLVVLALGKDKRLHLRRLYPISLRTKRVCRKVGFKQLQVLKISMVRKPK